MWHRAWLRERKLTGGKTYYVCWYGADGRQRQKAIGTDKRLAVELARRKEIELNSGLVGEPQPISFKAFVAEHEQVTEGRVAPATLVSQKEALEVLEELAKPERLTDIDGRAVQRFVAARCRAVRPATVNKEIRTLRAIFKKAIKRGYLDKNPFDGVEKLREPERSIRILSLDEIDKLLAAAPSLCWKTFVYLALIRECAGVTHPPGMGRYRPGGWRSDGPEQGQMAEDEVAEDSASSTDRAGCAAAQRAARRDEGTTCLPG